MRLLKGPDSGNVSPEMIFLLDLYFKTENKRRELRNDKEKVLAPNPSQSQVISNFLSTEWQYYRILEQGDLRGKWLSIFHYTDEKIKLFLFNLPHSPKIK